MLTIGRISGSFGGNLIRPMLRGKPKGDDRGRHGRIDQVLLFDFYHPADRRTLPTA